MPEQRAGRTMPPWWLALGLAGLGVAAGVLALPFDFRDRLAILLGLAVCTLAILGIRGSADLRRTRARYQALVEQLPGAVYVAEFEAAGRWLYVSPQIERILGYTADAWTQDPTLFDRILEPEDEASYRA